MLHSDGQELTCPYRTRPLVGMGQAGSNGVMSLQWEDLGFVL